MSVMSPASWDLEYDVVVAGYGFAGGMAAVTAHDEGARVAMFEKTAHFGGNSILSGGSCAAGTEYQPTLEYLLRTCAGTTDREVLEAFARGMVKLPEVLERLAAEAGFQTVVAFSVQPSILQASGKPVPFRRAGGRQVQAPQHRTDPTLS